MIILPFIRTGYPEASWWIEAPAHMMKKMLKDRKAVQRNMLTNPFEKFERKRFLYYSKDLSVISMNHALFGQMKAEDWERVRKQMREDLRKYYDGMGGV